MEYLFNVDGSGVLSSWTYFVSFGCLNNDPVRTHQPLALSHPRDYYFFYRYDLQFTNLNDSKVLSMQALQQLIERVPYGKIS